MTTQNFEDTLIGSADSGVEETLGESFMRLALNGNSTPESLEDESLQEPDNTSVSDKDQPMPRQMSLSSEETSPSGTDDQDLTNNGPLSREERVAAIKEMLEIYFSDNYLTRDIFLLKHFRRSKEGWISLKFMAVYKRIKRITKSLEEVKEAAQASSLLQVNVEGNKVRRLAPMPACIDEYIPTRMMLVGELPNDLRNLTALSKYMATYGTVASIQLMRPGVSPPEVLRETVLNFPKVREQWCALIEFEEIAAVEKLMDTINGGMEDNGLIWAMELIMPWRSGKTLDFSNKPNKNRCMSCSSSGYSSPCLTPDQSPSVAGRSPRVRGYTKRERLVMQQVMQHGSPCHSYVCQHPAAIPSPIASPRKYHYRGAQNPGRESPSPRRSPIMTEASRSMNWRAPMLPSH